MNNKNLTLAVLISIISIISFSSCNKTEKNLKRDTYIAGAEIIDNIIKTYQEIEEENYISKYQNELISILTSTDSESIYDFTNIDFTNDYENKLKAFRSLKKVYNTYNLLTDQNFNTDNTDLSNFIVLACNSLDTMELKAEQSTKVTEIIDYVSASNFEQEVAIYELSLVFQEIWIKDSESWKSTLNHIYKQYSEGLEKVPSDIFDENKLTKFVYEPYQGKETLVKIYKLNLKDEAFKQVSKSLDKINFLTNIFEDLNFINMEYTKRAPAIDEIEYTIDNIMEILFPEQVKINKITVN